MPAPDDSTPSPTTPSPTPDSRYNRPDGPAVLPRIGGGDEIEELPLALGPELVDALPRLAAALTGTAPIHPVAANQPSAPIHPVAPIQPVASTHPVAPAASVDTTSLAPSSSRVGTSCRLETSAHDNECPLDGGQEAEGARASTAEELSASIPEDLAVVIGTSGSTGAPKLALLSARALATSIGATHRHLGGPGQWLLAIPPHHIAGLQVLLRGLVAGTRTVLGPTRFDPTGFAAATRLLDPGERHYTSLVPTQVARLLDHPDGPEALRAFDAVLVGGAALPEHLRARADREGVVLVATYGMSETAGGCVYDGQPLEHTSIRLDDEGRIHLGGDTLAHGYLGDPTRTSAVFSTDADGRRWFRTDDHGEFLPDARLHVTGRLDDLINTGGLKVAPRLVEDAILAHVPHAALACVVGLPDEEWGQVVAALIVPREPRDHRDPATTLEVGDVRAQLRGILPDHALPKRVVTAPAIPERGPGKPDRRAVADLLTRG